MTATTTTERETTTGRPEEKTTAREREREEETERERQTGRSVSDLPLPCKGYAVDLFPSRSSLTVNQHDDVWREQRARGMQPHGYSYSYSYLEHGLSMDSARPSCHLVQQSSSPARQGDGRQ